MILAVAVSLAAVGAARADAGASGGAGGILQAMIDAINSSKPDDAAKIDDKAALEKIKQGNQKTARLKSLTAPSPTGDASSMAPQLAQLQSQLVAKSAAAVKARDLSAQAQAELDKIGANIDADLTQIRAIPAVNAKYDDLTKITEFSDVPPQEKLDVETLQANGELQQGKTIAPDLINDASAAVDTAKGKLADYKTAKDAATASGGACETVTACTTAKGNAQTAVETALTKVNAMRKAAGAEVDALYQSVHNARTYSLSAVSNADLANPTAVCSQLNGSEVAKGDVHLMDSSKDAISGMKLVGKQIADISGCITKQGPTLCQTGAAAPSPADCGIDADP